MSTKRKTQPARSAEAAAEDVRNVSNFVALEPLKLLSNSFQTNTQGSPFEKAFAFLGARA